MIRPIVKSSGLYFRDDGNIDAARFARLFKEVWKAIPMRDRKVMVKHWRSQKAAFVALIQPGESVAQLQKMPWPRIEVLSWPPDFQECYGICFPGRAFGSVSRLAFWAFAVEKMPDQIIKTVIAHELGHAYLFAIDDYSHSEDIRPQQNEEAEIRADLLTRLKAGEELTPTEKLLAFWPDDGETEVYELISDWGFYDEEIDEWAYANRDAIIAAAMRDLQ